MPCRPKGRCRERRNWSSRPVATARRAGRRHPRSEVDRHDVTPCKRSFCKEWDWVSSHVDMMFHVFCELGHGVGLDAAARGMGIAGKTKGMNGAKAPLLWAEGKREEVLRYVAQDVRTTMELATACEACGAFRWVARSGKVRSVRLSQGWLTVEAALELPLPDTSWMDAPWPRTKFTGWMGADGRDEG